MKKLFLILTLLLTACNDTTLIENPFPVVEYYQTVNSVECVNAIRTEDATSIKCIWPCAYYWLHTGTTGPMHVQYKWEKNSVGQVFNLTSDIWGTCS